MSPAEGEPSPVTAPEDDGNWLTQNEECEAVEQGTDVGQDPHQHGELQKRDKTTSEVTSDLLQETLHTHAMHPGKRRFLPNEHIVFSDHETQTSEGFKLFANR